MRKSTGNTCAWEQRKLDEFVSFFSGLTYSPADIRPAGTLVLRSSNVKDGEVVDADNVYVDPTVVNSENVRDGDIIVVVRNGSRALIGKHAEIKGFKPNTVIGAFMTGIRSEHPSFLNALLNTPRFDKEVEMNMGATINQITGYMFSKMEFMVPSSDEQDIIGDYFKKLDNLITLHQREESCAASFSASCFGTLKAFFWEQRKLGDLAVFNPKTDLPDEFEYVDLESVVGTEMLSHRTESKRTAPSRAQRLAQTGDLFYQTVRPYQKNNYLFEKPDRNYVFSTGYAQMRPVTDGRFLLCLVQNECFVKVVLDNCTGTSYPAINSNDLAQIDVYAPRLPQEQRQIGNFFKYIDTLITLHQCKLEKLKIVKKSMLVNCFPKNGEKVPKFRFSGFTGDWEQRKVGEVIEDYVEKTTVQNQYPVLTSSQQQGIVLQEDYFADRQVTTNDNVGYYVLPRGYFTYRSRSDTDLFVFNRNNLIDKGIISYYYPVFRPKNADSNFLLRRLNNGIRSQVSMAAEGTGQHVLAHSKLKNMEFLVPSVPEQKLIGAYFEILDHLITLHQRELKKLQMIKKSMLRSMFV